MAAQWSNFCELSSSSSQFHGGLSSDVATNRRDAQVHRVALSVKGGNVLVSLGRAEGATLGSNGPVPKPFRETGADFHYRAASFSSISNLHRLEKLLVQDGETLMLDYPEPIELRQGADAELLGVTFDRQTGTSIEAYVNFRWSEL